MYSRFTALQNHSEKDQEKLEESTAAVIGVGATGSAIAENLARHGVNLIIFDRDYLEEKDTYSSSIYTPEQCKNALPKSEAAKKYLKHFTQVEAHNQSLSPENIGKISEADIILDGTDNLETRQLINDYSKKEGIPWIYTAAIAERAYSMPVINECFNCVVNKPEKVATCEMDGIMRETAQKVAASTSRKAVKYLTDSSLEEKLEIVHKGRKLSVDSQGCPICSGESFPNLEKFNTASQVCGEGKYQLQKDFSAKNIKAATDSGQKIVENEFLTRICYQGSELTFFHSGRVIVEAEDEGHAEALVSEVAGI